MGSWGRWNWTVEMVWGGVVLRQSWDNVFEKKFFDCRANGRDGKMVFEGSNGTSGSSHGCREMSCQAGR